MPENKTTPVEKAAVKYKTGLLVSNSPHLVTKLDTRKTMLYVLIGLVPCAVAATIFFGPGALARILFGAVFAFLAEFCYDKIMKKPDSTGDLSCLVTGTILAMNVPADFPIWMLCIGCCVAIIIVKCLYGGIGRNIANPAIVGRIVLLLSWTSYMTTWPVTNFQKATVDATTGATPLGLLSDGSLGTTPVSLGQMFMGNIGGALGETCTLAILIGGAFLIWKKIISPIIPCAFIGTVFLFALLYYGFAGAPAGYNAFTMALAKELAPSGIRVNAIAPGCVDTDMNAIFSEEEKKDLCEEIPIGRFAEPSEIAEAAWSLMNLSYVTGQVLGADGGFI